LGKGGIIFVLAEQRFEKIVKMVEEKRSVTIQELMKLLKTSESTIRRDLTTLHRQGKLIKVFGGAVALESGFLAKDDEVAKRSGLNKDEKMLIAKYAAGLMEEDDFIYLDAGTTTESMIEFLKGRRIRVVTNAVTHALKLVQQGCKVYLVGGELKSSTEAIVGNEALLNLEKYNFNIGFFGTNGISKQAGFTTPDVEEAMVKKSAMGRCRNRYILADSSKFSQICPVTFGKFSDSVVITNRVTEEAFFDCQNIISVENKNP